MSIQLRTIVAICLMLTYINVTFADIIPAGQKVYNNVGGAIFTVYSVDESNKNKIALGSAVAIGTHFLATNCHVALAGNYLIVNINKNPYMGKLFYYNQKRDLCIIEVDAALNPVNIRPSKTVKIGEEVYAIGNPEGFERTISRGIISNEEVSDGVVTALQTDAAISHGSSGGGLFDKDSKLIGITTSGDPSGNNLGFAIPTEYILDEIGSGDDNKTTNNSDNARGTSSVTTNVQNNMNNSAAATTGNQLSLFGYYGKDKIGLFQVNNKCLIAITGTTQSGKITSLATWFPDKPNDIFVFSRMTVVEETVKFMTTVSNSKNSQFTSSKSYLFFDEKLHPISLFTINNINYPVYYYHDEKNITEEFLKLDYFLAQFYHYNQSEGMTTIEFGLDGFTEALAAYEKNCE